MAVEKLVATMHRDALAVAAQRTFVLEGSRFRTACSLRVVAAAVQVKRVAPAVCQGAMLITTVRTPVEKVEQRPQVVLAVAPEGTVGRLALVVKAPEAVAHTEVRVAVAATLVAAEEL